MDTYASKIRYLRDIPDEWIVFDFIDTDDETQKGLRFYQVCVDHDDVLRTEVNIRDDEGEKMFDRESTADEAISIMQRAINGIDFMNLPGWRDITKDVLDQGEASSDDDETVEEEYPGIPKADFDEIVALYMENPYWRRYYETAPSEVCKEFITMEFFNSEHQTPEAEEVLCEMEDDLGLEDWKHLLKFCGNNPRKAFIQKVINAITTHNGSGVKRVGRALFNPYYQDENENDVQP